MKLLLGSGVLAPLIKASGPEAFLDAVAALPGVVGVEWQAAHLPVADETTAYFLRQAAARRGLCLPLFSLMTDFGHPDRSEREKEMESVSHWAELAAKLGAQAVRVLAGQHHGRERDFVELVRCLTVSALLCEGAGLLLALENDTGEDGLVRTPAELENTLESLEVENAALAADLAAFAGGDAAAARRLAGEALYLRWRLGEDTAPVRAAAKAGFKGWLLVDGEGQTDAKGIEEALKALVK